MLLYLLALCQVEIYPTPHSDVPFLVSTIQAKIQHEYRGWSWAKEITVHICSMHLTYFAWLLCSYELAYDGERTTCNGATTATFAFPQATTNLEKMKEKWNSLEKPTGAHDKGPVPHAHNGEKMHANHSNNGEIGGSHQGHSMVHHNGEPHEHYRWSKCKQPLPLSSMRSKGVPLPADYVEVS